MHILLIGLSAAALGGAAIAQPTLPDQGAAPPARNPNMGDGVGAGPAGIIGDPNGPGPGAAAPGNGPVNTTVERPPATGTSLSKSDALVLKTCLAMPRESMSGVAKCRSLMTTHPDLFK